MLHINSQMSGRAERLISGGIYWIKWEIYTLSVAETFSKSTQEMQMLVLFYKSKYLIHVAVKDEA